MNVQRSPPHYACDTVAGTSGGSQPDLSKLSALAVDPHITFRNKRKHECECATEIKEMRSELSRIGSLLEKYVGSNEQIMIKMQESISEVKAEITELKSCNEQTADMIRGNTAQINEIKSSTSGMISEHKQLKTTVSQFEKQLSLGEHKIKSFESELNSLKPTSESATSNFQNKLCLNEQIIKEVANRNSREKNIIVVGLPEQSAASAEERASQDEADILKITLLVSQDLPKPIKTFRIGKYSSGKNRRIKVCYCSVK